MSHTAPEVSHKQSWLYAPFLALLCRILVGSVFVFAGVLKLLAPPEEFAALLQEYQVIPTLLIQPLALLLPWIEFLSGSLLLLGWFTRLVALVVILQLLAFFSVLSLVLLFGIPLEDCGCFGGIGIAETPLQGLIRDVVFLGMMLMVLRCPLHYWSLDRWLHSADT
jgi:uncharacterized membrane protein YphA (DoxX/SURF4 family)